MEARSVEAIQMEILKLKEELTEARRCALSEPVADHDLTAIDGTTVRLSELFGDKRDLLLVHNMGQGCNYCTLWADGLNGFVAHLESRAAFGLVSADPAASAAEFAKSRGWTFRVYSGADSDFTRSMGYLTEHGAQPGVSAFHLQDDGTIVRTGRDAFGPGDDYCSPFPLFDLLAGGIGDWEPRQRYERE